MIAPPQHRADFSVPRMFTIRLSENSRDFTFTISHKTTKEKTMYDNIYIKNYNEVKSYAGDIGVQLGI